MTPVTTGEQLNCHLHFLFKYCIFSFQASKAEKYEKEILKYKETLNEMTFFKSRVEVRPEFQLNNNLKALKSKISGFYKLIVFLNLYRSCVMTIQCFVNPELPWNLS